MTHVEIAVILGFVLLFGCVASPPISPPQQGNMNCSNYSYSDCPSDCVVCPPCAACSSLSCQTEQFCQSIGFNRTWAQDAMPKNVTPIVNPPQNSDVAPVQPVMPDAGMNGQWTGTVREVLHGPEGSFPEGCSVKQDVTFAFAQDGNILTGTTTSVLTNISGCDPAIPSSMMGTRAAAKLSGTISGSSLIFTSADSANLGYADFTATLLGANMTGTVVTCHSPDARCTCDAPDPRCPGGMDANGNPRPGHLETINWWTGDFTASRTG